MSFWKRLFEAKPETEEIEFSKLADWLRQRPRTGVEDSIAELREARARLEELLVKLEEADIDSMNVEPRLKVFVKGNRPAYVKAVRDFLKHTKIPESITYQSLMEMCKGVRSGLNELGEKTRRSFMIIQNLIGKELTETAKTLKEIDILAGRIEDRAMEEKIGLIEDVERKLSDINSYIFGKAGRKDELKRLESERDAALKEAQRLGKEVDGRNESADFKRLEGLRLKEEELEKRIAGTKSQIDNGFQALQKALKKLAKGESSKAMQMYADEPFNALLEDSEMEIAKILPKAAEAISSGKVELKPAISSKALKEIEALTPEMLTNARKTALEATAELKQTREELSKNTFEQDTNRLIGRLNEHNIKLAELDTAIGKLQERNIAEDLKAIEKDLERIAGHKATIKNAPLD